MEGFSYASLPRENTRGVQPRPKDDYPECKELHDFEKRVEKQFEQEHGRKIGE